MNKLTIDKNDFEKIYNKLVFLYRIGEVSTVEISEYAIIAQKLGYKTNFNFELEKEKICHCSKHPKIISDGKFVCSNCKKTLVV